MAKNYKMEVKIFKVFWAFLCIVPPLSLSQRKFSTKGSADCLAHSVDRDFPPLLFDLNDGAKLGVTVPNLNVFDMTFTSLNGVKKIVIKRHDYDTLSIKCGSQSLRLLPISPYLDLYFYEGFLFVNGVEKTICDRLFSYPKNFHISFRFKDPFQSTFKGYFAFNCFQGCWIYEDMNITIPMTSLGKITLYYKANEEGQMVTLNGFTNITLVPNLWWKKLSVETDEEREVGRKLLLLREENDLLLTKRFTVSHTQFLWTTPTSGVYWTRECLPDDNEELQDVYLHASDRFYNTSLRGSKNLEDDKTINGNEEESFLGTGLSKDTFYQIMVFLGGLVFTAAFATICSLCLSRRNAKKRNETQQKKIPQNQNDYEKANLNGNNITQFHKLESPEDNIYETPEIFVSIQANGMTGRDTDKDLEYIESDDGYMEMRSLHTSHLLKEEMLTKYPTKSVYESLGSLLDREDSVYETIKCLETVHPNGSYDSIPSSDSHCENIA